MQCNAAAQPTPSDPHIMQGRGLDPLLEGHFADLEQHSTAALTLFTFGLWLIVWFVVATMRESTRQKVRMRLIQEKDKITAELSGSDSWGQTTEAFIRRNLKG